MQRIRKINSRGKHKNHDGKWVLSPFIAIQGKSIARCGFDVGDKVFIRGWDGVVIVKKLGTDAGCLTRFKQLAELVFWIVKCWKY